ncbi:hypothetical protein RR46_14421 [Papilio xuthus]|uniref:Uncharacterized protein n=1 Tax=Papilio xuthus TaxID=66420 RepID=A0A194PCJ6_PAPXU|nr:hypothetical protein RR46_14421 [Papilio xuthus]
MCFCDCKIVAEGAFNNYVGLFESSFEDDEEINVKRGRKLKKCSFAEGTAKPENSHLEV